MLNQNYSKAGRRKTAIARVRTSEGEGRILINDRTIDDYFMGLERHKKTVLKPLEIWSGSKGYDFYINVRGGGNSGQAGAISHGLARTLLKLNADLKPA
ncbi:MAG: 30S ribosomal protein S9, partial [Elusimicrobiota bacterium]|nr:30S ribosomal protein S9 [Elusimicrobiota bacterium]